MTLPQMINALGVASPLPPIGGREFDNLFLVSILESEKAGITHLEYGKRSS